MGFYQLRRKQLLPVSLDELWSFISTPNNLNHITPTYMDFKITSDELPSKIYPGLMIGYTVKPIAGIKMNWITEITHVADKEYFVDEQRIGPFTLWHHEHILVPQQKYVLMADILSYKPPLGILGDMVHSLFLNKQLNGIFDYRERAINKLFSDEHQ
jgi:ligand-binding SRPBCC domain-containing protein